jgi:hypothetical protein
LYAFVRWNSRVVATCKSKVLQLPRDLLEVALKNSPALGVAVRAVVSRVERVRSAQALEGLWALWGVAPECLGKLVDGMAVEMFEEEQTIYSSKDSKCAAVYFVVQVRYTLNPKTKRPKPYP